MEELSSTRPEVLLVSELHELVKSENSDKKLNIPRFQRGTVWSASQKQGLIDSITKGYPVGALLVHERFESLGGRSSRRVWELIDGLQRTSTLVEYVDQPFKVAQANSFIAESDLEALYGILEIEENERSKRKVSELVGSWLTEVRSPNSSRFKATDLVGAISKNFPLADEHKFKATAAVESMLQNIPKVVQLITATKIPVIVFNGSSSEVQIVFERVNRQGTKLDKYQTFAAAWTTTAVHKPEKEIQDLIFKKYTALTDLEYDVSGFEDLQNGKVDFNLYEYLFGLGKQLAKKFPNLFSEPKSDSECSPVAFVAATVAHRLPIAEMHELAELLKKAAKDGKPNLHNFQRALTESCEQVDSVLAPLLKLKLNQKKKSRPFIPHSDNQIFAYIIRYMIEKFDFTDEWTERKSPNAKKLLANIPTHYLFETISGVWGNAGDSRLYRTCWEGDDPSSDLLFTPSKQAWVATLDRWFNSELSNSKNEREKISNEANLFFRFLYKHIISFDADQTHEYQVEHLYAVKYLKERIDFFGGRGWPINCVGNLALLPKELNEEKGAIMVGDYMHLENTKTWNGDWEEIQKLVITPDINSLTINSELDELGYKDFCTARFEKLKEMAIRNLDL